VPPRPLVDPPGPQPRTDAPHFGNPASPRRDQKGRMATTAAMRAQLTGPGGPFDVVSEADGGVELKVYMASIVSLREVVASAQARGNDQPFLVYGDLRLGPAEFVERSISVAHHLHDGFGVGHGDRVAVLSANNPEWCYSFWATVNLGAILVGLNGWWKA